MSSIVTAVFKVTIGLLVNKGRDKAAEKLKDGDVTDQKFRGLIVREIDDIKSKLDGLSRKDLGASISSFKEGIELLYEVFNNATIRNKGGAATAQAACAEAFTLAEEMTMLKLTGLDESAERKLSSAKRRFEHAREKASEAFNNEALEISDRILAMQYRVMATILETVDNPEDALAPCRVCIEELNSLSAVQNSFNVQLKRGIRAAMGFIGKDERRKIISSVCHVNRVIYDVTRTVGKDSFFWISSVDVGEGKVDPLRDRRVAEVLRKQDMEHCSLLVSFGQEGEEEHKLNAPRGIATNSSGQFIVSDINVIKMFDSSGQFIKDISIPNNDVEIKYISDVATDNNDYIYVLVGVIVQREMPCEGGYYVYEFSNTAGLHNIFSVDWGFTMTVNNSKVLLLSDTSVAVYDTDGRFVRSFGKETLKHAHAITAVNDGRVMVVEWCDSYAVHIFSEDGDYLRRFELQRRCFCPSIVFHRASEHVVIADYEKAGDETILRVEIFTKDGEFVRSTQILEKEIFYTVRITVTKDGRIAVLLFNRHSNYKSKVLVI